MSRNTAPSQSILSSYFQTTTSPKKAGKRTSSPIDLTSEGEEERSRPPKRARLSARESTPISSLPGPSSKTSVTDSWRYSPEKSKQVNTPTVCSAHDKARHEAFKRMLLQDNNHFLKTDHTEATTNYGRDDSETADVDEEGDNDGGSGNESDRFQRLTEMFAHKDKGNSKAKAKTSAASRPSKKLVEIGPSGQTYTPLEKQVSHLKQNNPGTVLMVEVGYKYKFFGDDAKVAAKELGMVAFVDRNFLVASIPVHRREVHLKKLLSAGYRVGIVNQIETAALKKIGDNRNAPFDRQVTNLYTAATYIEELNSVDDLEKYNAPPFMCIVEEKKGTSSSEVSIGMITVCPSTGDVVWDDFDDTIMRLELETRLVHTRPAELLVSKKC